MRNIRLIPAGFLTLFLCLPIGCGGGGGSSGFTPFPTPSPSPTPPPAPAGAIAFVHKTGAASNSMMNHVSRPSGRSKAASHFPLVMEPIGTTEVRLMDHEGGTQTTIGSMREYESVLLSDDRTKIAFSALDGTGFYQIHIANADMSGVRRLTSDNEHHWEPQLSHDNTKVVFVKSAGQLAFVSSAGSPEVVIPTMYFYVEHPIFTPSGKVVFEAFESELDLLMAVNLDGSNLVGLISGTWAQHYAEAPSISPDGTKIVFSIHDVPTQTWNVYIADFDAAGIDTHGPVITNVTMLTTNGTVADNSFDPVFVDDRVVFIASGDTDPPLAGDYWELYSMNYDGSDLKRMTTNSDYEWLMIPAYMFY